MVFFIRPLVCLSLSCRLQRSLTSTVKIDAVDMSSLKQAGNEAFKNGRFEEAVRLYGDGLEKHPEEAAVLLSNRSAAYLKLDKVAEAVEDAKRVVQLDSTWPKGYTRLAAGLVKMREFKEAKTALQKANDLAPEDTEVSSRLSFVSDLAEGLYFRQLLVGRDLCSTAPSTARDQLVWPYARQMENFIYLVGDSNTRECVAVDPCWDVDGIESIVALDDMTLSACVLTHGHFDHCGGLPPPPFDSMGVKVPGVADLVGRHQSMKVHLNEEDVPMVRDRACVPTEQMKTHKHEEELLVGEVRIKFYHTPGHTPGSQCIYVSRPGMSATPRLLSGDTLFIGSCGRLDLPESNAERMYDSLHSTLSSFPDDLTVYPGHNYGGLSTTIGRERQQGMLRQTSWQLWRRLHKL